MVKTGLQTVAGEPLTDYRMRLLGDLSEVEPSQWDALLPAGAPPFVRHAYLRAMEQSGSVGADSGWSPCHLSLWVDDRLVGAVPMYRKTHSWGEYVFDWAWADAYHRNGLRYYPKLLSAVPFTPVAGPRLLSPDPAIRQRLAQALIAQARQSRVSSLHVLFPPPQEAKALEQAGCMIRHGVQFHWRNTGGWQDFESFLAALSQPKRKKIRAERRKVAEQGVNLRRIPGAEISDADWRYFIRCYDNTYAAHGSSPYLNLDFFRRLGATMPQALLLVLAEREGKPVASSLLMRDEDRIYGRYWGATTALPFLHFECAYYQAIEAALELGIDVIEGGAQGEHKMARGFLPVPTCSAHWLREPAFADAVERFLEREGAMVSAYLDELQERSPFGAAGLGEPEPPPNGSGG